MLELDSSVSSDVPPGSVSSEDPPEVESPPEVEPLFELPESLLDPPELKELSSVLDELP